MKHLIKEALDELAALPYSSTTKKIEKTLPLESYSSLEDISAIAEDAGITLDKAYIGTEECNTLGGESNIYLGWEVEVDKSPEEIKADIKARFNRGAFQRVFNKLTPNGYKRIPSSTSEYRKFDQYNIHDLYYAEEWDILEAFYSLAFKKPE